MAEQFWTTHCEPCRHCRIEAWQHIVDGRLRWEESESCDVCGVHACGGGWGPAPERVRERIVACEGSVRLAVGGPDGAPLKAVREVFGLSLPQLRHVREHGMEVTPVEAQVLSAAAGPAGPG
ncbi:hypothetical protein [Streptomyces sp. NPDC002587]